MSETLIVALTLIIIYTRFVNVLKEKNNITLHKIAADNILVPIRFTAKFYHRSLPSLIYTRYVLQLLCIHMHMCSSVDQ